MKPSRNPFAAALACSIPALLTATSAHAASSSWNANSNGNWDGSGTNRWLGSVVPGSTTIDNTDIATFSYTLGISSKTVTVDTNRYIGGISFGNTSSYGYILSSGILHLNNGGVIQTLAANGNHTDTISSAIVISGTSAATATFTGGASSATSLLSIGAVTGSATTANTTTLTLNGANTGANAITGIIGNGAGGGKLAVVKDGAGSWTLSGANTFTGGLNIQAGTVKLVNTTGAGVGLVTLGVAGDATSGTLDLNGGSRTINSLATAGTAANQTIGNSGTTAATLNYTDATTSTFGGVIKNVLGSGTSTTALALNNSAANLTLSGANTFSGGLTLTAGTLVLGHNTAAGSGALTLAGGTIQGEGGARTITNSLSVTGNLTYSGSQDLTFTDSFDQGAGRIYTVDNTTTFSGAITGGDALTKNGTGTLILSGAGANVTGTITVNAGTLQLGKTAGVNAVAANLTIG